MFFPELGKYAVSRVRVRVRVPTPRVRVRVRVSTPRVRVRVRVPDPRVRVRVRVPISRVRVSTSTTKIVLEYEYFEYEYLAYLETKSRFAKLVVILKF